MRRLKHSEIKKYREKMLSEQGFKCGLSGIDLTPDRAVLDHNHEDGIIRKVLDRGVNCFLGKIENGMAINKITEEMLITIIENLLEYMRYKTELIHPTHRTPEEKKALQAKRRKNARKRK